MSKRILTMAVGLDGIIGVGDKLPWSSIAADMAHFKDTTTGGIVIMGRKTWENIPAKYRPLPDRVNVVVTSQADFNPGSLEVEVIRGFDEARIQQLENKFPGKNIHIVGGADLYNQAIAKDLVTYLNITYVGCPPVSPSDENVYVDVNALRKNFVATAIVNPLCVEPYHCMLVSYRKKTETYVGRGLTNSFIHID